MAQAFLPVVVFGVVAQAFLPVQVFSGFNAPAIISALSFGFSFLLQNLQWQVLVAQAFLPVIILIAQVALALLLPGFGGTGIPACAGFQ